MRSSKKISVGVVDSDEDNPPVFKLKKKKTPYQTKLKSRKTKSNITNLEEKHDKTQQNQSSVTKPNTFSTGGKSTNSTEKLSSENSENDDFYEDIPNIKHIEFARKKRDIIRHKKGEFLFKKMDIDESSSMKNRDLYDFALSDSDPQNSDGEPPNQKPPGRLNSAKTKPEETAKNEMNGGIKREDFALESLSDLQLLLAKHEKEAKTKSEEIGGEVKEVKDEIELTKREKQRLAQNEAFLAEIYLFFQNIRELTVAICFCLTEKIPSIEKSADTYLKARKTLKNEHCTYYLKGEGNLETIHKKFSKIRSEVAMEAEKMVADVNEDLIDIKQILLNFISMKEKHFNLYCQNFIPESLPSLLVPLFGLFLLRFTDVLSDNEKAYLAESMALAQKLEINGGTENGGKSSVVQKICDYVLFPFVAEVIDFEWDVFSLESTDYLLDLVEFVATQLTSLRISLKPLLLSLTKRLGETFLNTKNSIKNSANKITKIFIYKLLKVFQKLAQFFGNLKKDKFGNNRKIMNLIDLFFRSHTENFREDFSVDEEYQRIIEIDIGTRNILKTIKDF